MKSTLSKTGLILLIGGCGLVAFGALRPEGDKIEFSPPREALKVPPMTGNDVEGPTFNFQRREPGSSVSDIPAAIPLPSPDRVNRMRALEEMIEKRNAWARSEDVETGFDAEMDLNPESATTDFTIDDLYERRDRGLERNDNRLDRFGESDRLDGSGSRDNPFDRNRRDGLGPDGRSRGLNRDKDSDRDIDRTTNAAEDDAGLSRDRDVGDPTSARRREDRMGPTRDPMGRETRGGARDGLFEFGSLVPKSNGLFRDADRSTPTREDRMDSLRRVFGSSSSAILGPSATKVGSTDAPGGAGLQGVLGTTPGANRNLGQVLDSRTGANPVVSAAENPTVAERWSGAPNRPFGLDLTTGREGFGSRSERLTLTPPTSTPMEMFRRKHEARIPTRDF